jgi:hypothetical protein
MRIVNKATIWRTSGPIFSELNILKFDKIYLYISFREIYIIIIYSLVVLIIYFLVYESNS